MTTDLELVRRALGRTALCHEWIVQFAGSDTTSAAIARALGVDDVYTLVADQRLAAELFGHPVRQTWLGKLPSARTQWGWYLPLMPLAWRSINLGAYDTVLTSSHATVNSVRVRPGARLISFCHTPMRYAWEWREELGRFPAPVRPVWPAAASVLRRLDRRWSQRVSAYVVFSRFVAERVRRFYGRDAVVLGPPIDTDFFTPADGDRGDFFLWVGRMVSYKRPDVALEAAKRSGFRLVLVGTGPLEPTLRDAARGRRNIEVRGFVPRDELRDLMREARALLHPGVEDFGNILVEVQAAGTPVIALGRGGAAELVLDGRTGVLYSEPTVDGLISAVKRFDQWTPPDAAAIRDNAMRFAASTFPDRLAEALGSVL